MQTCRHSVGLCWHSEWRRERYNHSSNCWGISEEVCSQHPLSLTIKRNKKNSNWPLGDKVNGKYSNKRKQTCCKKLTYIASLWCKNTFPHLCFMCQWLLQSQATNEQNSFCWSKLETISGEEVSALTPTLCDTTWAELSRGSAGGSAGTAELDWAHLGPGPILLCCGAEGLELCPFHRQWVMFFSGNDSCFDGCFKISYCACLNGFLRCYLIFLPANKENELFEARQTNTAYFASAAPPGMMQKSKSCPSCYRPHSEFRCWVQCLSKFMLLYLVVSSKA